MLLHEPPSRQANGLPIEASEPLVSPVPDAKWVKGHCPVCSAPLVLNTYWRGGIGYYDIVQCWNALLEPSGCTVWDFVADFGDGSEKN